MKYLSLGILLLLGVILLTSGYGNYHSHSPNIGHPHEGHSHEGHSHDGCAHGISVHDHHAHDEDEPEVPSFTIHTQKTELFVAFEPLVVGESTYFAAHFTNMENYKPVASGNVVVHLMENGKPVLSDSIPGPAAPGIFRLRLTPEKVGKFDLDFILETATFKDRLTIKNLEVYPDKGTANAAVKSEPEGDEVAFLKEQAWKVDFGIAQAKRDAIHEVIRTSGEILPVKGDESMLSANTSGLVFFKSKNLMEGREVRKGEVLFVVNSKGLTEENMEEKYRIAQAELDRARADLNRAEGLFAEGLIARQELEEHGTALSIAEAAFKTLAENFKSEGMVFTAPFSGIIKNLPVSDGEFVGEGQELVTLTRNRKLLIEGEVSQRHFAALKNIRTAHFKTPWQDKVYRVEDFNGRLVSYGKLTGKNEYHIPVLFEVDNRGDLLAGSYVDLYLLTRPVQNTLVIPKSALLQDYDQYYVYVQRSGESFEKKEVHVGIDDGKNIQVLSGVEDGEWVVTEGAYQIKMAAMSSSIPSHGHTH